MALRETENNAYAKFWGDKQKALWYVMVFSRVVDGNIVLDDHLNYRFLSSTRLLWLRAVCLILQPVLVKFRSRHPR